MDAVSAPQSIFFNNYVDEMQRLAIHFKDVKQFPVVTKFPDQLSKLFIRYSKRFAASKDSRQCFRISKAGDGDNIGIRP